MPIRSENRARYSADWRQISAAVRERANQICEWCGAVNHEPHPATGKPVVLTVAHLDHTPENNDPANLRALCQPCHLRYDAKEKVKNRAARRLASAALYSTATNYSPADRTYIDGHRFMFGELGEHVAATAIMLRDRLLRPGFVLPVIRLAPVAPYGHCTRISHLTSTAADTRR
jgi:hypothetical protein